MTNRETVGLIGFFGGVLLHWFLFMTLVQKRRKRRPELFLLVSARCSSGVVLGKLPLTSPEADGRPRHSDYSSGGRHPDLRQPGPAPGASFSTATGAIIGSGTPRSGVRGSSWLRRCSISYLPVAALPWVFWKHLAGAARSGFDSHGGAEATLRGFPDRRLSAHRIPLLPTGSPWLR